ncbi:MAG TPA: hypothetical protein VHJ34_03985 [Actinomycetota bacterium]|nr:hypothetical protein [Actinomycetota bacterium]
MVDRTLRAALRNYTTLFLVAAALTVPLHVAHAFVYRDVLEVADLHGDIEEFPAARQVRSVGRDHLDNERRAFWAVNALELLLVPLLAGAARRVFERERDGRLPGVLDALARAPARLRGPRGTRPSWAAVAAGAAVALVTGVLVERILLVVAEPVPDVAAFAGFGLAWGVARAAAAPFVLAPLALGAGATTAPTSTPGAGAPRQ